MGDVLAEARKWLLSQGYPLEMRIARECRRAGARVSQSRYYRDPTTDKFREMDLVATFAPGPIEQYYAIELAIECEADPSGATPGAKPWLVFTTESDIGPSMFAYQLVPRSEAGS